MNEEKPHHDNAHEPESASADSEGAAPEPAAAAHSTGEAPPSHPGGPGSDGPVDFGEIKLDDRTMALLCHLLGIFTSFLGPLVIWLIKKEESAFVNDQGREALNWQITLIIVYAIGIATSCIGIGFIICMTVVVVAIIFGIIGGVAANKGQRYRYPFAIRLIK